MIQR
jgi:5-methyltetrahydrofolate--homocysteine methyltransferase